MKSKTLVFLITFMSVSILGLATIQIYWMNSAFESAHNLFEERVRKALDFTTNEIRSTELKNHLLIESKKRASNTQLKDNDLSQEEYFTIKQKINSVNINKRISTSLVDSLLIKNFLQWKIYTPIEFAIYRKIPEDIILSTQKYHTSDENITSILFFSVDNLPLYYLSVHLSKKNKVVLLSILGLFIATILSLIGIILIYIYCIFIMLKQFRVARLKTDFMNNMTHELKTPLATIGVAVSTLKNKNVQKDELKRSKYLDLIQKENKRMNWQIEKILQMAKFDRGEILLHKKKVNLHNLIEESVQDMSLIVRNRNACIKTHYDPKIVECFLDKFHIQNVLHNLVDNACKYTKEPEPQIDISTYKKGDKVIISIQDNGIGMEKKVIKHIFTKFYREESGNIHNVKGHGLGLYYVKNIIDLHKGQIKVSSEKAKGTEFFIILPTNFC